MFACGPLFHMLFHTYGFNGTFLILAGIAAQQFVVGSLMRPSAIELKRNHATARQQGSFISRSLRQFIVLKDPACLLLAGQYLLWSAPYNMALVHLPNFSVQSGYSEADGAFLLLVVGLGGTVGRIFCGLSLGPYGINPLLMNFGLNGLQGLLSLTFLLYSSAYLGQCLFAFVYGIYSGSLMTMTVPLTTELYGVEDLSTIVGTMYFFGGFGFIIGPLLAGW